MPQSHDSVYPWTSSSTIFARPVVEDNTLKPYSLGWLLKYGSTKAIAPTRKQITKQNKNLYMLSCKNISPQRLGCHMCENQAQDKWDNLQLTSCYWTFDSIQRYSLQLFNKCLFMWAFKNNRKNFSNFLFKVLWVFHKLNTAYWTEGQVTSVTSTEFHSAL